MALDERVKDVQLLAQGAGWLRRWVGQSKLKFIIVFCIALTAPVATACGYISYFLHVANERKVAYAHEVSHMHETNLYKEAIDVITSCLDSTQDNKELHTWYCDQAVASYREVSPKIKPTIDRVNDVIKRLAYRAMRNDVQGRLRGEGLQQELKNGPTNTEKILSVILSNAIESLFIFLIIAEGLGVYWFFRIYKPRAENKKNMTSRSTGRDWH